MRRIVSIVLSTLDYLRSDFVIIGHLHCLFRKFPCFDPFEKLCIQASNSKSENVI